MRLSRRTLLAATGSTLSIGVSGCLTGDDGNDSAPTSEPTDEAGMTTAATTEPGTESETATGGETTTAGDATGASTVQVRSHREHGDILVDADGMTLYMFDNDTKGSESSTCSGDCAANWPPLTVDGEPSSGGDVTAALTTFERGNGSMQVAASGWPLYYFASDEAAGDANGQGVGDVWWVLRPDGTPVKPSSSGPGYGY